MERVNKLIIQSDQMRMGASRSYASSRASYTRYNTWNASGNGLLSFASASSERQSVHTKSRNSHLATASQALPESSEKRISEEQLTEEQEPQIGSDADGMKNLMEQMNASSKARRATLQDTISNFQKIQQQAINYLFDLLFSHKSRIGALNQSGGNDNSFADFLTSENSGLYGAGGSYYSCFYYSEQETTCFDAKGTAVTADGREIPFNISLEMSRSFTMAAEQAIDFGQPRLCDPLVINLSGGAAGVTDQKFYFDIDADGVEDEISSLSQGSGYLALDKNGDGVINDGSELFGTASGNGFSDLAAYDRDKNGWIDEADEIFSLLKIWTKDENGNDKLLTLAEAGVGAIYLGYEDTDYSLNSLESNETNAVIRKTGIFLYENGDSGTVQQLDLAT
ncbi:MAG: hypothetical protein NC355_05405 [Blautia sp.]|nr:hypothetical protein [Blautia sp.]